MATGTLPLPSTMPTARPQSSVEALFRTPVPPFHLAFPSPPTSDEVAVALQRAANRVYHEGRKRYGDWGLTMAAPALLDAIREDVMKRILALAWFKVGPLQVPTYQYLKGRQAWAWFPPTRTAVEAKVVEMRKRFRKPRPRFETKANNHLWGRPDLI